jgi:transcriptional regulator with XRE-family HTH domain
MTSYPPEIILRAKILGALLRDARLEAGKTIEGCAQLIGVSNEVYEAYELGEKSPSLPELEGLAYYLEVPLEHFWETQALRAGKPEQKQPDMKLLILLRNRMVGALLRQARLDAGLSLEMLADRTHISTSQLEAYELGQEPVPLPFLEFLSSNLNRSIREFHDRQGPVGVWVTQQRALQDFMTLSVEMQEFVSKPINRPYLDLARRLSDMSVDKLRAVAEGLLEITY